MICSTAAAHVPLVLSCLVNSSTLAATLNRSLFRLFVSWLVWQPDTDLFRVSSTCVNSFVSFTFTVCWLTLNRSLFRFCCIWHFLLTRHWFFQCQQLLYIGIILQYNSDPVAADFEQVTVSIRLFFTWVLCVYILLDKSCHIFYLLGLNSTVWPGHLWLYDGRWLVYFFLRLRIKSF